jgi:hypothetical protein
MLKRVMLALVILAPRPVAAASASPSPPAGAALRAFGGGESYERLFQDNVMPATCAIVLERARCMDDLHVVVASSGPREEYATIEKWFATGDVALRLQNWDGTYILETTWTADPAYAWWYTAGIVSIAASLPQNDATTPYLAHYLGDLTDHAASAPDGYGAAIAPSGGAFERLKPLQSILNSVVPVSAYPVMRTGESPASDARLGLYYATLEELVDSPLALSRPESRAFAIATLNAIAKIHQSTSDGVSVDKLIAAFESEIPSEPAAYRVVFGQLAALGPRSSWPVSRREAFFIGAVAAQVAYNAAATKDAQSDDSFRGALAKFAVYPGISDAARSDVSVLLQVPSISKGGKWEDINAAGTRATLAIAAEP